MADEKVEIVEVQIDTTKALKDLASSQRSVKALKDEIKELQKAEGDNSEEIAVLSANLKAQQKQLRTNTSLTENAITASKAQTGSIEELRAQLAVTSIQWSRLSEDQRQNTEEGRALAKQKLELTKALKGEEEATGDARRNVGNYTDSIGKASEALTTFVPGAGAAGGAVKQLGIAVNVGLGPIGLLIAAIALVVAAFKSFFTSTQEGQDTLKKFTAAFEVATSIITSLLSGLAEALLKPKEALDNMRVFFQDTLGNIITGIFENAIARIGKTISYLAVAWEELKDVFMDNAEGIAEANARVERANQAIADSQAKIDKGVENTVKAYGDLKEAIKEVVAEGEKQIEVANRIVAAQIALEEANIRTTTSLAKLNAEAERQQAIADDATLSFEKRRAAEDKARKTSEDAAKIGIDLARQELKLIQLRNDQLNRNGQLLRENRQEEAGLAAAVIEAEAKLTAIREDNAKRRREISRDEFELNLDYLLDNFDNVKSVNEKLAADDKRTFENRSALIENTKRLGDLAFKEQIAQIQTRTDAEINASDLLAEEDSKRLIERVRLLELGEKEETRLLEVIRDRRTAIQDLAEAEVEIEQQKLDALQEARLVDLENQRVLNEQNIFGKLELERQGLELQRAQELEYTNRIGADTTLIEAKYSKARQEISNAEFNAKASLAADFANNIAQIAGENTAVGKAAAVAAATINTYQAATGAYASLAGIPVVGPALGIAAAAAAVVSGIANVKKILSVKTGLPGEGAGAGGGGVSAATPAAPPTSARASVVDDVNTGIVSRDSASIGPVETTQYQPTLVTDDVTVSQDLEAANNQTATV